MPAGAYVLMTAKSGSEQTVVAALKKMAEVKDVKILYGEYDVIAKIQVDSIEKLDAFVPKVRAIDGVEKTNTLIVAT